MIPAMPLMRFIADSLGALTICLVAILFLLGLFCILYSIYFRTHIIKRLVSLRYFGGPWIIRIAYVVFSIWWGIGEIVRLNLSRHKANFLDSTSKTICNCYIVSNLGFAEPCLFLTLALLIRASIQRSGGTLSPKWNAKTAAFVLIYCLPMFVLQLIVILVGPKYKTSHNPNLPSYFITAASKMKDDGYYVCTYPLFSTIFLGLFAILLSAYTLWNGRQVLHWVINKGLQRRVYALIFLVCSLFPLRAVLLSLTVLPRPEALTYDALTFLAFLSLFCGVLAGVRLLVYLPIADSLSLRNLHRDSGARMGVNSEHYDDETVMLMAANRREMSSSAMDSISFHSMGNKDESSEVTFVELTLFNADQHFSPLGSPRNLGRPMISP